jgi:hypothetical protein
LLRALFSGGQDLAWPIRRGDSSRSASWFSPFLTWSGSGVLFRLTLIKKDADLVASHHSFGPFLESGILKLDLEALPPSAAYPE